MLVGITDTAFPTTIELALVSKDAGASAVLLMTPCYFLMEQLEARDYIEHVLDTEYLPVTLYSMPGITKAWPEVVTLRSLSNHPKDLGIKDSSGSMEYFAEVCNLKVFLARLEHICKA